MILPSESAGSGPKFLFGTLVVSERALAVLTSTDIRRAFVRHITGDWGEVSEDGASANERALTDGGRILSVYRAATGISFYMTTDPDRRHTVVILPEEY